MSIFNKSSSWWFGENSIFGQAIGQTKWGGDNAQGTSATFGHTVTLSEDQKIIMYALVGFLAYSMIKK